MIALITARAGSKRLPNKNILDFCGRPLISWTVNAAIESCIFERVFISTDCKNILSIYANDPNVTCLDRPEHLSDDYAKSEDVCLHFFEELEKISSETESFALLQPTSPLRNAKHLKQASRIHKNSKLLSVIACTSKNHEFNYKSELLDKDQNDFSPNGAFYFSSINNFKKQKTLYTQKFYSFNMPIELSIDIDHESDFIKAQEKMQHIIKNKS